MRVAIALVTILLLGGAASAQQPAAPPPPLVDWDKVEIKTTDLGNNTWMLQGQGGNITIAVGTDGIIMVDGQFAPLSDKIKAAIKAISPLPIKYLINTHYHGDHTGGNKNFAREAPPSWRTTICVCGSRPARSRASPATSAPRPAEAFRSRHTSAARSRSRSAGEGGADAHLQRHTDGDTWVYLSDANVL